MYNLYCLLCNKMYRWETKLDRCLFKPNCGAKLKLLGKSTLGGYVPAAVHAIYETDTGKQIPVDKKGNVLDNNPYEGDTHGWKRAGKKVKDRRVIFK